MVRIISENEKLKRRNTALKWYHAHKNDTEYVDRINSEKQVMRRRRNASVRYYENKDWYNKRRLEMYRQNSVERLKLLIRMKTAQKYSHLKTHCWECGAKENLEFAHISYVPNVFGVLCRECHGELDKLLGHRGLGKRNNLKYMWWYKYIL